MYKYFAKDLLKENENIAVTSSYNIHNTLPIHTHDFLEIVYIYSGSGYHILSGEKYEIKSGDLFFVAKNSPHTFLGKDESLKWLNIIFLPSATDKNVINATSLSDVLNLTLFSGTFSLTKISTKDIALFKHEKDFHDLFFLMLEEYNDKRIGYQDILRNYLSIVLTKIFRTISENAIIQDNKQCKFVNEVLSYLSKHSTENIKMKDLAKNSFFSPTYFPKVFKKQTGITISQFIQQQKLKIASDLLVTTNYSIIRVMEEVGYSDTKFFYKIFKNKFGKTPAKYREENKK